MDYLELQQQIAEQEARIESMKAALKEQEDAARVALSEAIKQQIADHGFTLESVLALLSKKPARKPAAISEPVYRHPEQPELTYTKGPRPNWLKARMQDYGLDPTAKDAIAQLKEAEAFAQAA